MTQRTFSAILQREANLWVAECPAVANEMDALLSWNFKHIVRRKTRDIVKMVNTFNRLGQIEIMTPAELL